jgi:hypothetical protein
MKSRNQEKTVEQLKTKPQLAAALRDEGIPRNAFTIPQFCARNSISEGLYRKLRADGRAPLEIYLNDRVLISLDAEREWIKARTAESVNCQRRGNAKRY